MWGAHEGMGWWMVFGAAWMVLFWGLIIAGIAWVVTRAIGPSDREDSATEIARKRYASGEITREEFQALSEELKR